MPGRFNPFSTDIVQFSTASHPAEGITLNHHSSSTDSNIPISLGITAITISQVASGSCNHSGEEWIGIEKADNVNLTRISLATILATAGM